MTMIMIMIMTTIFNNILKYVKKNYKILNIVFLLLAIYVILFPVISIPINAVLPQFGQCPYLRITGKPCPLCGGTRYIRYLPEQILKNSNYLLHPFGVIVLFIIFEILFRIYNLIKNKNSLKLIKIDINIHLFVLILFFSYEIIFLIIQ